jgi:hypothetical protein
VTPGVAMEIAIDLPDDIARQVQEQWGDIPRHVLEKASAIRLFLQSQRLSCQGGAVVRRDHFGGLLRYYYRDAA